MPHLNKKQWILGIAVVFLLILTTNLIDRQNFKIIEASIETIYADRIVAQDIIYDISKEIGLKQVAYATLETDQLVSGNNAINTRIKEYISLFANTKLTAKEQMFFSRFKDSFTKMQANESSVAAGQKTGEQLKSGLTSVRENLDELANVQVEEGKRELYESKKALGSAHLFTQLEIAALIVMALLIQIIVLYTPKLGLDEKP